jgi:hypothetical protein
VLFYNRPLPFLHTIKGMGMKSYKFLLLAPILLVSCQSSPGKNKAPLEITDITNYFQKLPKETQKKATENGWTYFSYAFSFENFQTKLLNEFPSLGFFGKQATLIGRTPLDLRPMNNVETNPIALMLSIDLEMEILSRFHSNTQASPHCLEDFWSEWGLYIPRAHASNPYTFGRTPTQSENKLTSEAGVPLNERSKRLAIYLRQSLALSAETPLTLLSFEDPIRAQFAVNNAEVYEIFSSPLECKTLQDKKQLIPFLGKMKCLQKQSATWITVAAKESTVVSDNWVSEVKQRCQRWVRPISDQLRRNNFSVKDSPLSKSWSLYPRLNNFIKSEADRYEASFRQIL